MTLARAFFAVTGILVAYNAPMMTTSSDDLFTSSSRTTTLAILTGAVAGGFAGYMLLTADGRRLCRAIGAALEDVATESVQFANSVRRAQGALTQSWNALGGGSVLGSAERQASGL
jgi:hypothetical protein